MPLIHVYMWPGRTKEQKMKMVKGITKVMTDMKIPAEAVEIVFHEVAKDSWAEGGELHCDKYADH